MRYTGEQVQRTDFNVQSLTRGGKLHCRITSSQEASTQVSTPLPPVCSTTRRISKQWAVSQP